MATRSTRNCKDPGTLTVNCDVMEIVSVSSPSIIKSVAMLMVTHSPSGGVVLLKVTELLDNVKSSSTMVTY